MCPHEISTGDAKPIHTVPYQTSVKEEEVLNQELEKLLGFKIIRESKSPWAARVVIVTKKDGTMWFCTDYWNLNAVTKRDA
jgi:hypothetical protein